MNLISAIQWTVAATAQGNSDKILAGTVRPNQWSLDHQRNCSWYRDVLPLSLSGEKKGKKQRLRWLQRQRQASILSLHRYVIMGPAPFIDCLRKKLCPD